MEIKIIKVEKGTDLKDVIDELTKEVKPKRNVTGTPAYITRMKDEAVELSERLEKSIKKIEEEHKAESKEDRDLTEEELELLETYAMAQNICFNLLCKRIEKAEEKENAHAKKNISKGEEAPTKEKPEKDI